MMKKDSLKSFWCLLLFILFALILITNIKAFFYNCFNAYDLGLYSQAVIDMTSFKSANPYLPIRGLPIFNDHFMPVLYLGIPFVWLFNMSPLGLIFLEWFAFLIFIALIFKEKSYKISGEFLLSLSYVIFCKGFITALIFPVHPGVWSVPLWFLLVKAIKREDFLYITLYSFFLMTFRESFPFAICGLAFWYLLKKNWRQGFVLFLGAFLYLSFVLWGRKVFLGEVYDYGGEILKPLVYDTFNFIASIFKNSKYNAFFKSFYPLIIPLVLLYKLELKKIKDWRKLLEHPSMGVFFLILPLLALHFLANKIDFQYSAPVLAPVLSLIILSSVNEYLLKRRGLLDLTVLLFILSSMSYYKRFARVLIGADTARCELTSEKLTASTEVRKYFEDVKKGSTIFSTRKIVPALLNPGLRVFSTHYFTKNLDRYDYLVFGKEFMEAQSQLKSSYERLLRECEEADVAINNSHYLVLKGSIDKRCYEPLVESTQRFTY